MVFDCVVKRDGFTLLLGFLVYSAKAAKQEEPGTD
jgi:hypothetical protein